MGPEALEKILDGFEIPEHPDLLVGIKTRDDAGVFKLNDQVALVQTLDFFTPVVDDPYLYGQIAATNSLNDVYSMGGKPLLAMNMVCFPECGDMEVLRAILAGGLSKIKEAGALLVGGHTVDDNEPKYGLAVTGIVHPDQVIRNSAARPGDLFFLTKPLGSGIINTSIKAEMTTPEVYLEAVHWMSTLNKDAAEAMQEVGIRAATDITGFGLLGHLYEMADSSHIDVEVYTRELRFMPAALEYTHMGLIPAGTYKNRDYLAGTVDFADDIDGVMGDLLFTPETAGGLLIAVAEERAGDLVKAMERRNSPCFLVGRAVGEGNGRIRVVRE